MLKLFVIKNIILYGFNSQINTKQLLTIIKYCVIIKIGNFMLPYILLPIKNKGGRDFNEMSQIDGIIIPFMLLRFLFCRLQF